MNTIHLCDVDGAVSLVSIKHLLPELEIIDCKKESSSVDSTVASFIPIFAQVLLAEVHDLNTLLLDNL